MKEKSENKEDGQCKLTVFRSDLFFHSETQILKKDVVINMIKHPLMRTFGAALIVAGIIFTCMAVKQYPSVSIETSVYNFLFSLLLAVMGVFVVWIVPSFLSQKEIERSRSEQRILYSRKPVSERGYPWKLLFMALCYGISIDACGVPFFVGACFLLFAVLSRFVVFYIAGGICLLFYIFLGIVKPIVSVMAYYSLLGARRFYTVVDTAYSAPIGQYGTRFKAVMIALESAAEQK